MKKIALTALTLALALGATAAQAAPQKAAAAQKFQCQKGINLTVKKAGQDKISVHANTIGKRTVLKQVPSGSGMLFANEKGFYGNSTEFHQKGKEAHFTFNDPYGNEVSVACRGR